MSWVTIIWSMVASACLTLAAMNLLVWLKERTAWSYLLISVMAAGTAGIAFCELSMMLAATPAEFGRAVWWGNIPVWMVVVSLVLFVRLYLRSGRMWLAWTIIGMRTLALILNVVLTPNLNYREIISLQHLRFLGESVSVARGLPNPWQLIAQVAVLLLVIFVVDAAVSVRRRPAQRRSFVLISGILFFLVASLAQSVLVFWGILPIPITFSFFSLAIVSVMAYEMSLDVQRAAQLSNDLRESEARLRDVTFSMAEWVWELDEKGVYTYSSAKGSELFGLVIGKTLFDLMPPDEASRVAAIFSEITAKKLPIKDLENWKRRKDGERICLLTNGVPLLDEAGNLKGYRGVDKDITERKVAEAARREDMARYQAVVEAFDGFIYICSQDYRVEYMNQRMIERTGRNARGEMCYKALHDSDSVCEWCVNERVFQGETVRWEVQSPKDHRWYYVVNYPIRHADGTMSKQSMIMDITERRLAEEALKKSEEALRYSQKDLQRLAGRLISAQEEELRRLSRELHDDLTQRLAVLAIEAGKLELDLERRPNVQGNAVRRIVQIKDQLIRVSEDVHNISRQIHPTILDDLGLVRAIESECAMFLRRHSITPSFIKDHVPDAIPDDIALCLYRVVQEGLRNIAIHSRAKSCKIVLHLSGDAICLAVTDDGVGFDPLEIRNTPGLGLSSMRERVQLVEGDFAIRSQPGKGTEITVCVPLAGGEV
ncbi:MAG: PAS domain S-box protein [Nitrospirae bacterium]|nr:PAS domain S-box protein [Nitrospirota bacterium]